VAEVFKRSADLFNDIVTRADYESALRFYNCKGITSFVAGELGMNPSAYCTMITGIVRSGQGAALAADLQSRIS